MKYQQYPPKDDSNPFNQKFEGLTYQQSAQGQPYKTNTIQNSTPLTFNGLDPFDLGLDEIMAPTNNQAQNNQRRKIFDDDSELWKNRPDNNIFNSLPEKDRTEYTQNGRNQAQLSQTNNFWDQIQADNFNQNQRTHNNNDNSENEVDLLGLDLDSGNQSSKNQQTQNFDNRAQQDLFDGFDQSNSNINQSNTFKNSGLGRSVIIPPQNQQLDLNKSNPFSNGTNSLNNSQGTDISPFEQNKQFFQQSSPFGQPQPQPNQQFFANQNFQQNFRGQGTQNQNFWN